MLIQLRGRLKCCRCGHTWLPRQIDVRKCPRCQTAYWEAPPKPKKEGSSEHTH